MQKHSDPKDLSQYNIIQRNALRLQGLINQLLDLSRLEAGKHTLHVAEYDFASVTRSLVANFESLARERNITLTFQCEQ